VTGMEKDIMIDSSIGTDWERWNKNIDINFRAHDAFLDLPSSCTPKFEILERQLS
jgi:hypothetical protein